MGNVVDVSKRRRYNPYYAAAKEVVRTPKFMHEIYPSWGKEPKVGYGDDYINAYGTLATVNHYAELYREDTRDKVIVLVNEETGEIIKIPYFTRLCEGYYERVAKEILKLVNIERFRYGIFATYTADPKRYMSPYAVQQAIAKEHNRLRTWMKKNPNIMQGWKGEYIAIWEIQEKNTKLAHLHVIYFEATWADVPAIRDEYETYMGKGTQLKVEKVEPYWYKGKDGNYHKYTVIHYLLKYLMKASRNNEHVNMLWALGVRTYNTSRGLLSIILDYRSKNNSNGKWVYLGAYDALEAKDWTHYNDFLRDKGFDDG